MALSYKARKRWSLVILLIGLPAYIMVAVTVVGLIDRPSILVERTWPSGTSVISRIPRSNG